MSKSVSYVKLWVTDLIFFIVSSESKIHLLYTMATQTINRSSAAGVRQQSLPIDNHRTQDYNTVIARPAWAHYNESSNDFRSDFLTKPSLPMLDAIVSTPLGDGYMGEDETTRSFQKYVADLVGHEASILVMTGSMGNQVALRTALRSTSRHSRRLSRAYQQLGEWWRRNTLRSLDQRSRSLQRPPSHPGGRQEERRRYRDLQRPPKPHNQPR